MRFLGVRVSYMVCYEMDAMMLWWNRETERELDEFSIVYKMYIYILNICIFGDTLPRELNTRTLQISTLICER